MKVHKESDPSPGDTDPPSPPLEKNPAQEELSERTVSSQGPNSSQTPSADDNTTTSDKAPPSGLAPFLHLAEQFVEEIKSHPGSALALTALLTKQFGLADWAGNILTRNPNPSEREETSEKTTRDEKRASQEFNDRVRDLLEEQYNSKRVKEALSDVIYSLKADGHDDISDARFEENVFEAWRSLHTSIVFGGDEA